MEGQRRRKLNDQMKKKRKICNVYKRKNSKKKRRNKKKENKNDKEKAEEKEVGTKNAKLKQKQLQGMKIHPKKEIMKEK